MRIFFLAFFSVYGSFSLYGALRWASTLPAGAFRNWAVTLGIAAALSFPLGRLNLGIVPEDIRHYLLHIGYLWMAYLPNLVIPAILWDIWRLGRIVLRLPLQAKVSVPVFALWTGLSLAIVAGGWINARYPVTKTISLDIPGTEDRSIRIALMTDLHISSMTSQKWLERVVEKTNGLSPDLILMAGDILDGPDGPKLELIAQGLKGLRAPLGVYGSPGNHEYYLGIGKSQRILESAGVSLLRDRAVLVDGSLWVLGREDVQAPRMGLSRSPLKNIVPSGNEPVVVLDHTPIAPALEEASNGAVDLLLSGHTHRGQLFPFQLITSMIYPLDWGLEKLGGSYVYVSCGVGTWGPPIRTSSRPEIVAVDIKITKNVTE
nr:metallophosphoesterase [uncultured Dethiosulfovibrio sp.]